MVKVSRALQPTPLGRQMNETSSSPHIKMARLLVEGVERADVDDLHLGVPAQLRISPVRPGHGVPRREGCRLGRIIGLSLDDGGVV